MKGNNMNNNRKKIDWWNGLTLRSKIELRDKHKPKRLSDGKHIWSIPMVDRSTSTITQIFNKESEIIK